MANQLIWAGLGLTGVTVLWQYGQYSVKSNAFFVDNTCIACILCYPAGSCRLRASWLATSVLRFSEIPDHRPFGEGEGSQGIIYALPAFQPALNERKPHYPDWGQHGRSTPASLSPCSMSGRSR